MSEALPATPPSVDPGPSGSILVVDDEPNARRFLADALRLDGHDLHTAAGARRALVVLKSTAIDLVLTDVRMPGEDGVWLLRAVRSQYPTVPVLLMTGAADPRDALRCLRMGALDYLLKPLQIGEVRFAVRRALERRRLEMENARYRRDLETIVLDRTQELRKALVDREEAHGQLLEALVNALDAREQDTHNHSLRVASYSTAIARRMGVEEPELRALYRGALLHDIGKIGIPDAILLKPSRLTEEEWITMRRHPEIGARILNGIPHLTQAREILLSHHERWDGQGYPRGLQGEQIPLGARIFAVADTFDVMTSGRPYRPPVPLEEVMREVHRCSATQFDPEIARLFLEMVQGDELRSQEVQEEALPERAEARSAAPAETPAPVAPLEPA
jgi:putative nucleotidyltransferase with HDIG domain